MSFMFDAQNAYHRQPHQDTSAYYGASAQPENLQFYSSGNDAQFYGSRPSLEGTMATGGGAVGGGQQGFGGSIQQSGTGWLSAFGTGTLEGEQPLFEELGINFAHIQLKTMTVLNPFQQIDERIMDDADLAGPLLFCFVFGVSLLLSGRPQFGYIYGIAMLGSASIYALLNFMSASGIDAHRTASVLGYCLLPMVVVSAFNIVLQLNLTLKYTVSTISILWSTYSASGIFVTVLRMSNQRLLVAYPVGLLYGCFALFSMFDKEVVRAKA